MIRENNAVTNQQTLWAGMNRLSDNAPSNNS
jgi:hypothetical protein